MASDSAAQFDRLFLALWPPQPVREALQSHAERWRWPRNARRVSFEKLHMTLHFLGNVDAPRESELIERLPLAFEPFELQLESTAVWGSGIAVLCARDCPDALRNLHAQLAQALLSMQLPVEQRPFRPHVTLARNAKGAVAPKDAPAVAWHAEQGYVLMRSLPQGGGYEIVKRFA